MSEIARGNNGASRCELNFFCSNRIRIWLFSATETRFDIGRLNVYSMYISLKVKPLFAIHQDNELFCFYRVPEATNYSSKRANAIGYL